MTKPPHIAVVVNLFHPQTGEECIIQPVVDALGSKQCFKNCLNQLLTAFFILGLYLKLRQHILILYVHIYIYLYIYIYICTHSHKPSWLNKSISRPSFLISAVFWQMRGWGSRNVTYRVKSLKTSVHTEGNRDSVLERPEQGNRPLKYLLTECDFLRADSGPPPEMIKRGTVYWNIADKEFIYSIYGTTPIPKELGHCVQHK